MAGKSKVLDYEPLRNPRRSTVADDSVLQPDSNIDFDAQPAPAVAIPAPQPEPSQILKRGHALTFAGLFIFTFILFFRPYEFSTSLMWLSRAALITAIVTLVIFIPTQLGLENRLTVRTREINLVFLLVAFSVISIPFALDRLRAWNGFVEYMKIIIMFIVTVNVVRSEKQLKALLLLILVATCILSISAINDYRLGNLVLKGVRIKGAIGGLFENPNDLALHFVTFFPIVIVLALSSRFLISKLIYFAAAAAALGGVMVTFSRGGFLGMIFVIAALVWKLARANFFIVVVISAVLIFFMLVLAPGAYRDRISTTGDGSSVARMGELKRSIFLSVRNPFFGVGMDNYVLFSDREQGTHNSYTQVSAEIGFAAMVVYILFLIATLKRVAKMPHPKSVDKRQRLLPYLAIGVQASLIGYMVTSFFAAVAFFWYVYYLAAYGIIISRLYQSSLAAQTSAINVNNAPSA
jgi:O-antigen ligase